MKKSKVLFTTVFVFLGLSLTLGFQNCGKLQLNPIADNSNLKSTSTQTDAASAVLIENDEGEILPAFFDVTISENSPTTDEKKEPKSCGSYKRNPKDIQTTSVQAASFDCQDELANFHGDNVIDISQQQNANKISVLSGKNFIYSSTGNKQLNEVNINIDESKGRLIICGLNIDKISVKKGRLDLIQSHIGSIPENKGTIKGDGFSTVGGKIVEKDNGNGNGKK